MSLLSELRRRNVFKVGAAYAIVGWLLLQVAGFMFPTFGAPVWVVPAFTGLVILGLPIAIVLAWAFELTPDGVKATASVTPGESIAPNTGRKLNYAVIVLLGVAVIFLAVDNYLLDRQQPAPTAASIAVLPFDDLSPDRDQEYFSDGLTEELLNTLAQIRDLQVAGRTSSFYFKDLDIDLREIGEMLGVAYLLEGSVRKDGDRLRITAQLIEAGNGYHLWSDTYDRDLADIFAIQDEIAASVTDALRVTLGVDGFDQAGETRNVDAYEENLRAMALLQQSTADSVVESVGHAERAVALDPNYGRAWMTLFRTTQQAAAFLPPSESRSYVARRMESFQRALSIMPDDPSVQLVLASAQRINGNWSEAEERLTRLADEGAQSDVDSLIALSNHFSLAGWRAEALAYAERAVRLDPLSIPAAIRLVAALFVLDRLDETAREIARALAIEPSNTPLIAMRWLVEAESGDDLAMEATLATLAENLNLGASLDAQVDQAEQAFEAMDAGNPEPMLALLRQLLADDAVLPFNRTGYAYMAATLGDPELVLEFEPGAGGIRRWAPYMQGVRQLPAFKTLVQQNGLVDYWRERGQWSDFCRPLGDDDFECF